MCRLDTEIGQLFGRIGATANERLADGRADFVVSHGQTVYHWVDGTHALSTVSAANHAALTGRSFFPHLISAPFSSGLHEAFAFAIGACLIAAAASLMRGGKYRHGEQPSGGSAARDEEKVEQTPGADVNGGRIGARRRGRDPVGSYLKAITTEKEQHAR